jgi:hypothetical protein
MAYRHACLSRAQENVAEEVDAPNEYFYDPVTQELLLSYNGTGAPPTSRLPLVAHMLRTLVRVEGTRLQPVSDLSFSRVRFTATASTYLDDSWDTPSGGDEPPTPG